MEKLYYCIETYLSVVRSRFNFDMLLSLVKLHFILNILQIH